MYIVSILIGANTFIATNIDKVYRKDSLNWIIFQISQIVTLKLDYGDQIYLAVNNVGNAGFG